MMPPCANAVTAGSDASLPTSHAWTTVWQPKIKSGAIDHSQAEVAKTFYFQEFGNGAANGGAGATYADASMLNTVDNIGFAMDDGLSSLMAKEWVKVGDTYFNRNTTASYLHVIFIGTGFSMNTNAHGNHNIVQNLPYGTHIFTIDVAATNGDNAHGK